MTRYDRRQYHWGGDPRAQTISRLVWGIGILALGVLFLLDSFEVLNARDFLRYWPAIFIVIGISHLAGARTGPRAFGGVVWIVVGGLALSNNLHVFRYAWPLVLVAVGARIIWRSLSPAAAAEAIVSDGPLTDQTMTDASAPPAEESMVSGTAFLSGFDRRVTSKAFRGGELTAFMGGGKIDLRDAALVNGRAVLDVFAMMGGLEIWVPETWAVAIEMTPILGGVEDKTRRAPAGGPVLVVRGFVMLGGVEIKN